MGLPTTPQEAAPAYEDVIHTHQFASGSSSGVSAPDNLALARSALTMFLIQYAPVPQMDIEQDAPLHNHTSPSPAPASQQPETLAQTIAGVFRPKPHVHCEACDQQLEARERRANERHCCSMVAWVFIVAFICAMILGIVVANATTKANRHH